MKFRLERKNADESWQEVGQYASLDDFVYELLWLGKLYTIVSPNGGNGGLVGGSAPAARERVGFYGRDSNIMKRMRARVEERNVLSFTLQNGELEEIGFRIWKVFDR